MSKVSPQNYCWDTRDSLKHKGDKDVTAKVDDTTFLRTVMVLGFVILLSFVSTAFKLKRSRVSLAFAYLQLLNTFGIVYYMQMQLSYAGCISLL